MFDLIKGLIKWIIIAILFVILIVVIVGLVKKTNTTKDVLEPGVKVITNKKKDTVIVDSDSYKNDDSTDNNSKSSNESLTVDSPDTASSIDYIFIIMGVTIISSGFYFIYKNKTAM